MAKAVYVGVGSKARKMKKAYIGIGGKEDVYRCRRQGEAVLQCRGRQIWNCDTAE